MALITFDVGKKPYFDINDTIDEVGISRRQLGYWESEGLIEAELGSESKKYTVNDIRRLKALRHLIVDRKLPLPLVKELVSGGLDDAVEFSRLLVETASLFDSCAPDLTESALDFREGRLLSKSDLASDWWYRSLATASEETVAQKVYELTLLLFRIVRIRLPRTAAFQERKLEIIGQLNTISDMARIEVTKFGETSSSLSVSMTPQYPDEDMPGGVKLRRDFLPQAQRLSRYRDSLTKQFEVDTTQYRFFSQRFWDEEDLNGVKELPWNWDPDDMGDVPF